MRSSLTHDQQLAADIAWLERREREVARPPRQLPACGACQHFTPDPINPPAGMGTCGQGHGMWHAAAPHPCGHHQPKEHGTPA